MTPGNNGYQRSGRPGYGSGAPRNSSGNFGTRRSADRPYEDAKPDVLPNDFVDLAMHTMEQISTPAPSDDNPGRRKFAITTSKIRNLLSLVMDIYNQEYRRVEKDLLDESKRQIQMARVRMIYEAGRDDNVRRFLEQSHLIAYLKGIGDDRARLIQYTQYLEALVAYHRYMGGREN